MTLASDRLDRQSLLVPGKGCWAMAVTHSLPRVLLVGGPDVDARLDLMHRLKHSFNVSALGSQPALREKFRSEGFGYSAYHLNSHVSPLSDVLTVEQLARHFRRLKPQIVHTFDSKPSVWGCLAARMAGVPVSITTVTGLGALYSNDTLPVRALRTVYQSLQKLACRFADLTIFQNHADARQFIAAGVVSQQKAAVILGSGVPTDVFAPERVSDVQRANLRAELRIAPGALVVTMISRVLRSKGVLDFMTVARDLSVRYPQARCLLVGPVDDQHLDRLNAAELSELKQTVIFAGPRRDIATVLAITDIFVLPSAYREGIPRVLLEAASMGLPLVSTDSPGCNDVLADGINGFLIPVRDTAALAKALFCLIEKTELRRRFGLASRKRVVERFDLSVIADQIRSVYRQLLERNLAVLPDKDRMSKACSIKLA